MISKVYEWLRAADLNPDDHMVTTRTSAVEDLVTRIRESSDYDLLLDTVTAAVGGCKRLGEQSSSFATILECVRTQAPAFPSGIEENGLHLRIICCLGLGQLLNSDDEDSPDKDELLSASLLTAGLGLKQKEAGRHLDDVFAELEGIARANLQRQAVAMRERVDLDWQEFDGLKSAASDPPNFNQRLLPAVKSLLQGIERQHQLDREELEVMWWLYNGYSEDLGKRLKAATPHLAATAIGSAVAGRISPPATIGITELVAQSATRDRAAAQLKAKGLGKIAVELGEAGRKLLLPSNESLRKIVSTRASLLPISWLCLRLHESQGVAGWEAELQSKAGLASDYEMTAEKLAVQVFTECQAQRVYNSLVRANT